MGFGNFYRNLRESVGNVFCQTGSDGVFCMEMAGINQIQTQIIGIPELVVFHIGSDEGIAAGFHGIHNFGCAGTAAHGDLGNRFACIHIAKSFTAQGSFDSGQEVRKRLFGNGSFVVIGIGGLLLVLLVAAAIVYTKRKEQVLLFKERVLDRMKHKKKGSG